MDVSPIRITCCGCKTAGRECARIGDCETRKMGLPSLPLGRQTAPTSRAFCYLEDLMAHFKHNCPRCIAKGASFEIIEEHLAKEGRRNSFYVWEVFSVCGVCNKSVIARFDIINNTKPPSILSDSESCILRGVLPKPVGTSAPNFVPVNVGRFYAQGMSNLDGNWDAAGSMFRKTLDVGLKVKFPEIKGKLAVRIDKAAEAGKLTAGLAEWSHKIRDSGNDAAHDEDPYTQAEAKELQRFTELVLMYLFTLPGMLDDARTKVAAKQAVSDT